METKELHKHLSKFGRDVVKVSKSNLTRKGTKDSGALYNSIRYELDASPNSFNLGLFMEDHGRYLDEGVRGAKSSSRAPNSPFRFGTGTSKGSKSMASIMAEWAKRKGLQWKDRDTGRFMSHASMGFLIARSKYNKGVAPSMFFTKPFEAAFKRLPDELVERFALDVEKMLKHTLKDTLKK